jgi:hypothetical protein
MNGMEIIHVPLRQSTVQRLLGERSENDETIDEIVNAVLDRLSKALILPPLPLAPKTTSPKAAPTPASLPAKRGGHGVLYERFGAVHYADTANDAFLSILRQLARRDRSFLERFAGLAPGRTRNHVARSRLEVYPQRRDLDGYVVELVPGWFVGTNIANREKVRLLELACQASTISFGTDLRVEFENA